MIQRAQWTESDLALPRITLHLRRLDAGGPLLVLLHGLSADGTVWQGVGRRLSPPFTLVAADLRGHGLSGHPATGYRIADHAADVAELLDVMTREAGGAVNLLGHSLGALAALGGAALRPPAVRRLVVVDPPLDGPRARASYLRRMLNARRRDDAEAIRALILEQTPGLSGPLLRAYEQMWGRVADGAIEAAIDAADYDVAGWYPRVAAPTLILRADPRTGDGFDAAAAQRAREGLRKVEIVTVEGASHNIHAVKPAEFARLVLEFLA